MKISYTYTDYKDCPELTEISYSRAREGAYIGVFLTPVLLLSLCAIFVEGGIMGIILGVLGIIGFILGIWYLATGYQKRTQELLEEAYARHVQNKRNKE